MNGTYYQNPTFPTATPNNYQDTIVPVGTDLTMEQSYIENILRLNKGKKINSQRTLAILFQVSGKVYKLLKVYKFKTHTQIPTRQFD